MNWWNPIQAWWVWAMAFSSPLFAQQQPTPWSWPSGFRSTSKLFWSSSLFQLLLPDHHALRFCLATWGNALPVAEVRNSMLLLMPHCPTHGEGCFQTKSFTWWISGRLCGIFHRPQGCRSHICDNILFHNFRQIPSSTVKILNSTNHFEVVVASWKSHLHPI